MQRLEAMGMLERHILFQDEDLGRYVGAMLSSRTH